MSCHVFTDMSTLQMAVFVNVTCVTQVLPAMFSAPRTEAVLTAAVSAGKGGEGIIVNLQIAPEILIAPITVFVSKRLSLLFQNVYVTKDSTARTAVILSVPATPLATIAEHAC